MLFVVACMVTTREDEGRGKGDGGGGKVKQTYACIPPMLVLVVFATCIAYIRAAVAAAAVCLWVLLLLLRTCRVPNIPKKRGSSTDVHVQMLVGLRGRALGRIFIIVFLRPLAWFVPIAWLSVPA
jgi:hypothetical protein